MTVTTLYRKKKTVATEQKNQDLKLIDYAKTVQGLPIQCIIPTRDE